MWFADSIGLTLLAEAEASGVVRAGSATGASSRPSLSRRFSAGGLRFRGLEILRLAFGRIFLLRRVRLQEAIESQLCVFFLITMAMRVGTELAAP